MKRRIALLVLAFIMSFGAFYKWKEYLPANSSIANNQEETEEQKLSSERGSITIDGDKVELGERNKKYRIILKKIYTTKEIVSNDFFEKSYEVPEYAQGIEVEDVKKSYLNRENIIVADDEGKAVFSDMVLGEYEISSVEPSSDFPIHTVRIPLINSTDEKNLNINLHKESIDGGAVVLHVKDSDKAVPGMSFALYKVDEIPVEGADADSQPEGEKTETEYLSDKKGLIFVNNLPKGKYYFKIANAKKGYIEDNRRYYFEIDSLGTVKHNGGIRIGKVLDINADAYKSLEFSGKANGKKDLKSNLATVFTYDYITDIPGNIKEYSNIEITDEFNQKMDIKSVEVLIDGVKSEDFQIENSNNNLRISVSNTDILMNKKKLELKIKAEIREEIDEKDPIENFTKTKFSILGLNKESISDKVTVTPTYGKLKLLNQDKSDKKQIHGSTFQLKLNDKVVKEGITDTRGTIVWHKVPYGKLQIVQSKTSSNYDFEYKVTEQISFIMDDQNSSGAKVIINSSKKRAGILADEYLPYTISVSILTALLIVYGIRKNALKKGNTNK